MIRLNPQGYATPDYGPMFRFWGTQAELALHFQNQMFRAMFAPATFLASLSSPCAPAKTRRTAAAKPAAPAFVRPHPVEPTAPVAETVAVTEPAQPVAKAVDTPEPVVEAAPVAKPAPVVETTSVVEAAPVATPAPVIETTPVAQPAPVVETASVQPEPKADPAAKPAPVFVRLDAPRGGAGDDLTAIKGVGPKLAEALNAEGIWHLDQLAAMTETDAARIDETIPATRGRALRDDWAAQARALIGA
ncbi:hypothetical protein [Thetidibacter halocola]|uniref:Uncharacterized protein n=1 Tax=Thetidibacter halocola TaxID=2827239 RepID=A0A8J7WD74_9RHOB|nr:hypothetical protein [Thetidibacter halocola]MBS0124289.1 hypothetical protein [Thetidibacter halocola]